MGRTKMVLGAAMVLALSVGGCDEKKAGPDTKSSASAAGGAKTNAPASTGSAAAAAPAGTGSAAAAAVVTGSASADAAAPPAGGATAGQATDLVKYMPKSCEVGRAYANLAKMASISPGGSVTDAIAKANQADPKAGKVLQALKDSGVDLQKALYGLALCVDKNDPVVAIGVNLDGAKPLDEIFAKVGEAVGEKKTPEKKEENGTTYYEMPKEKDVVLAIANPKVFLIGKKADVMPMVKAPGEGVSGFPIAADTLLWGTMKERGQPMSLTLTDKSPNLALVADMKSPDFAKISADPKMTEKFTKDMTDKILKSTAGFASGPLKVIAEDAKLLKVSLAGDTAKFELTIPASHVTDLSKTISEMKPEDLKKTFR